MKFYDKVWGKAPFIRKKLDAYTIMKDVARASLFIFAVSIFFFGYAPILIVGVAYLTAIIIVFLSRFFIKNFYFQSSAWQISILLFSLSMPPTIPWYVVSLGVCVILLFNQIWFLTGNNNIFNPALVGRITVMTLFPYDLFNKWSLTVPTIASLMRKNDPYMSFWSSWVEASHVAAGVKNFSYMPEFVSQASQLITQASKIVPFDPAEVPQDPELVSQASLLASQASKLVSGPSFWSIYDAVSGVTPIGSLKNFTSNPKFLPVVDLFDILIGNRAGAIGETSIVALLLVLAFLSIRKIINPLIPIIYVLTLTLSSYIFGGIALKQGLFYAPILPYSLFGGAMFMGIFMMTDYVTTPASKNARFLMAFIAGILVAYIRSFGHTGDPQTYVLLFINFIAPLIEKFVKKPYFGFTKQTEIFDIPKDNVGFMTKIMLGLAIISVAYGGSRLVSLPEFESRQLNRKHALLGELFPDYIITKQINNNVFKALDPSQQEVDMAFGSAKGFKSSNICVAVVFKKNKVQDIEIVNRTIDTKGIGDKIYAQNWEKQLIGLSTKRLYKPIQRLVKSGNVDIISGATTTAGAVLRATSAANDIRINALNSI